MRLHLRPLLPTALCLTLAVVGCATAPADMAPPAAQSAPVQSDAHPALPAWDTLATGLAERLVNRLSEVPVLAQAPKVAPTTLDATETTDVAASLPTSDTVASSAAPGAMPMPAVAGSATLATLPHTLRLPTGSPFNTALGTLLRQRLLQLGLLLDTEGTPAGHIDLTVQLIERTAPHKPLLLVSTQTQALGRLHAGSADLYTIEPGDLPLFAVSAPTRSTPVKTWRMATP